MLAYLHLLVLLHLDGLLSINILLEIVLPLLMASKLNCKIHIYHRLASSSQFADTTFRDQLVADLNQADDSKRTLKEVSALSANQLFTILGVYDPGCDKNNDGKINGDELKCLNFAWKSFLPK